MSLADRRTRGEGKGKRWKRKKVEHPRDSAELKGETNVWPREGNLSVAEQ